MFLRTRFRATVSAASHTIIAPGPARGRSRSTREPVLGGDDPGDLLVPYRDPVLDPGDDLDPLVEAHPGPGSFVEGPARDGDRPVHVLGRRVRDASDDLLGVRRDHLDDVLAQGVPYRL